MRQLSRSALLIALIGSTIAVVPQALTSKPQTQTVYVTRTGDKYHKDRCRYLSRSKRPLELAEAKRRGYDPCKVCRPPR